MRIPGYSHFQVHFLKFLRLLPTLAVEQRVGVSVANMELSVLLRQWKTLYGANERKWVEQDCIFATHSQSIENSQQFSDMTLMQFKLYVVADFPYDWERSVHTDQIAGVLTC